MTISSPCFFFYSLIYNRAEIILKTIIICILVKNIVSLHPIFYHPRLPLLENISHMVRGRNNAPYNKPKICDMKKTMMALSLCLMSVIGFANNRQVTALLPNNMPSVSMTIDGKNHTVKPTKAVVKEIDDKHVKCIVYANRDKAEVTLPISYDTILELGARVAELYHGLGIATDKQYADFLKWYNQQMIE